MIRARCLVLMKQNHVVRIDVLIETVHFSAKDSSLYLRLECRAHRAFQTFALSRTSPCTVLETLSHVLAPRRSKFAPTTQNGSAAMTLGN